MNAGFVEASIARLQGRTIHTFPAEGAGAANAPDIIKVLRRRTCWPSIHQYDGP